MKMNMEKIILNGKTSGTFRMDKGMKQRDSPLLSTPFMNQINIVREQEKCIKL